MKKKTSSKKGITRRDFLKRTAKGATVASISLGFPMIAKNVFGGPTKQVIVTAWDASGTAGWDFHKTTMKTQDKGPADSCYEGLVAWDRRKADLRMLMPGLAEDWEVSGGGLVWTFKLREGVRWHHNYGVDWGEFTSEDCEFSFNRGRKFKYKKYFDFIESYQALDKYTIKVTLNRQTDPNTVKGLLTNYRGGFIACKRAIEQLGDEISLKPVGTGFMKLKKYIPNTYSEWAAHEDYWRGRPFLDSHRQMYMKDLSSREMAFQKGEAQMIQGHLSQKWYEKAAGLKDADPIVIGPGLIAVLHINTTRKPFTDIRIRKALMHAIDREALQKFIGKDITKRQVSPVPHDYLGSTKDVATYDYDPDKARKLLEDAGYPKGFDTEMQISEIDDYLRPMQVIQQMLKKVGIKLGLKVITHSAYHKQIRKDVNPLVIYGCSRFPTGQQILTQFYHSDSIVGTPTAVTNFSHYTGVDKEIDAAALEVDVNKKIKYWQEAQKKVMDDAVACPLYIYMQCWVKKTWVDLGYEFTSNLKYSPLLSERTRILPH